MGGGVSSAADPNDPDDLKQHGNACYKAGDHLGAILHYSQALEKSPDDPKLYSNRSAAFADSGQLSHAHADALSAIKLDSSWAKGYFRAGVALDRLGQKADAISFFDKALALDPDNESIQKAIEKAGQDFNPALRGTSRRPSTGHTARAAPSTP